MQIETAEELKRSGTGERYIWMTHVRASPADSITTALGTYQVNGVHQVGL